MSYPIFYNRLPSFLCIGGQRCGSTWLDKALATHPQIAMSPKETSFFNLKIRTHNLEWYCNQFESIDKETIQRGDSTPTYSAMYPEEIALVKDLIPNVKIILIVRNPVDRLISQITRQWTYYYVDKGAKTTRNLWALLRQVDNGLSRRLTDYPTMYRSWSYYFGSERIFMEKYDTLKANPQGFLTEVLDFLEAEPFDFPNDILIAKPNKSNYKDEIPSFLKWYLATEWLPTVRVFHQTIDLDVADWIESMEKLKMTERSSWQTIRLMHKITYQYPYHILYPRVNAFRVKRKVALAKNQISNSEI